MRPLKIIETDITRCKDQLVAIFNSKSMTREDKQITAEGFQLQLRKLLSEKALHLPVHQATIILPNGSEELFQNTPTIF